MFVDNMVLTLLTLNVVLSNAQDTNNLLSTTLPDYIEQPEETSGIRHSDAFQILLVQGIVCWTRFNKHFST